MNGNNSTARNYETEFDVQRSKLSVLKANALKANYLERAMDMSMPVLKIADFLEIETDIKNEKQTQIKYEQKKQSIVENSEIADNIAIIPMSVYKSSEKTEELGIVRSIDFNAKSQAYRIADKIEEEIHKFWTNKNKIKSNIYEINFRNAFSFVGYMITTSDSGTVLGDIKRYISYNEISHIITCLLRQAKNAGLVDINQYKKLKYEHNVLLKKYSYKLFAKVDNKTIEYINSKIEEMYQEMTKIF